jgi:SOS response regulatory protein OraA/RecX
VDPSLDSALSKALGALQRRERTAVELRAWLIERDVAPEVAEEAIGELVEIGQLDDERFAFAFAQDKRDLSGWGGERIEAALLDRGIGRGHAGRASGEPPVAEHDRASQLAR